MVHEFYLPFFTRKKITTKTSQKIIQKNYRNTHLRLEIHRHSDQK
jgi:hypothetical protein